jgi:uncharacterized Zn finger protein
MITDNRTDILILLSNSLPSGPFDLKEKDVKVLCSERVFDRGKRYFIGGRVSNVQVQGLTLRGEVEGSETRNYKVRIKYENESGLIPKCSCPFDMEEFCKHSISVLLHWIHKREEFSNVDLALEELRTKSKDDLMNLIEEVVRINPSIIRYLFNPDNNGFRKRIEVLFSNYTDYYKIPELIEKLEEERDGAERLFELKNLQESFNRLKVIIDSSVRNYGKVDDSNGNLAEFIEESLALYVTIIQSLNIEWSVKRKIHEGNWKMFVTDEYGLSDYLSEMIIDSCTTENDFLMIEKFASEELELRKVKANEYDGVSEIVDILLDLYEKKKDHRKFLSLCEKEFKHSYMRYIKSLEREGDLHKAVQCCTRAQEFARGFMKTELIEKTGDLKHMQGADRESLSLYIDAFKDRPEEELLAKIKILSGELGFWKDVKDEITSFLEQKEDSHNLIEIYLSDGDFVSASSIASRYISNTIDAERVANACKKTIPDRAAELYQKMGEEAIKQSNRNGYRAARYYYKTAKQLYTRLGEAEEFKSYMNRVKLANQRKSALQDELTNL